MVWIGNEAIFGILKGTTTIPALGFRIFGIEHQKNKYENLRKTLGVHTSDPIRKKDYKLDLVMKALDRIIPNSEVIQTLPMSNLLTMMYSVTKF